MMRCQPRIYGAEFSREEMKKASNNGGLLSMEIEFNRECNFNCIYCYVQNGAGGRQEMTKDEICGVIIQAKDLGAKKIIVLNLSKGIPSMKKVVTTTSPISPGGRTSPLSLTISTAASSGCR